jgi:hypothetical protein
MKNLIKQFDDQFRFQLKINSQPLKQDILTDRSMKLQRSVSQQFYICKSHIAP